MSEPRDAAEVMIDDGSPEAPGRARIIGPVESTTVPTMRPYGTPLEIDWDAQGRVTRYQPRTFPEHEDPT